MSTDKKILNALYTYKDPMEDAHNGGDREAYRGGDREAYRGSDREVYKGSNGEPFNII